MEDNTNTVVNGAGETTVTEPMARTYSQEEVDALLQSETDRRVTSALKKAEQKNAEKLKEAQRLAQMNEKEKYEYELQQREQAIAAKERELALMENKNEASKILAERGISLQLVDFVVAESADDMKNNIDLLDKAFTASVKAEVEKRLAGSSPKKGLPLEEKMTADRFKSLKTDELAKLYKDNPEIFNQFK